ncbi:Hpt domain-containing protein [Arthrobacter yangruifuii]|uniref:Hpt domain-containing protein n=1 Tax=Arthrobacter yangruifuii TaxID=2606616 RepID=UPI00164631B0|nr:Hpt domain-containing protein [Arthrobacter yangruifuii]
MSATHSPAASAGRATEPVRRCTGTSAEAEHRRPAHGEHQVTAPLDHPEPQLISLDKLRGLIEQVGTESCRQFVSRFVSMWDGRVTRLHHAVQERDFDAAMDVVLSIKISSHMAGAERLSALGEAAQGLVVRRDVRGLEDMLAAVRACGIETMAYLNEPDLFPAA